MKAGEQPLALKKDDGIGSLRLPALRPYLELMRLPNLWTAVADILAGYAVAGRSEPASLFLLSLSSVGLYGGGVVLNDLFDADLDRVERPERPLPSGRASTRGALGLAVLLLSVGIGSALIVGLVSGLLAIGIALTALLYNARTKRFPLIGPVNMGLCRALNLLLGVSALPAALLHFSPLALIPWSYIAGITLLSRGEVHGARKKTVLLSAGSVATAFLALSALPLQNPIGSFWVYGFLALLSIRLLPRFRRAYLTPEAGPIRAAVKSGVLSLILLDAAMAAVYGGPLFGLAVLSLSPVASKSARLFAVT